MECMIRCNDRSKSSEINKNSYFDYLLQEFGPQFSQSNSAAVMNADDNRMDTYGNTRSILHSVFHSHLMNTQYYTWYTCDGIDMHVIQYTHAHAQRLMKKTMIGQYSAHHGTFAS